VRPLHHHEGDDSCCRGQTADERHQSPAPPLLASLTDVLWLRHLEWVDVLAEPLQAVTNQLVIL
jgi:hypothetical protein